jgi:polyisoprenoid-binding protein YceI
MTTWAFDPSHAQVEFSAKHMMITTVRGHFGGVEGTIEYDESNPLRSTVTARIPVATIDTGFEQRDGHLRSPDFLDAENHPYIEFRSTRIEPARDGALLHGDLTIRGVTRPVTLEVEQTEVVTGLQGGRITAFSATTKINREDWGLTWNVALESGGWVVGKEIKIAIEIEAAEVLEAVPAAAAV